MTFASTTRNSRWAMQCPITGNLWIPDFVTSSYSANDSPLVLPDSSADRPAQHWTYLSMFPSLLGLPPKGQPSPMTSSGRFYPACSDFVTDGCVLTHLQHRLVKFAGDLSACSDNRNLLLDLLWLLVSGNRYAERLLLRLSEQEASEPDIWLRDDIRISWLTVLYAARGYAEPHVSATYQVLGIHPAKVYQAILDRRMAVLGADEYQKSILPPKKPASKSKDEQERAA